MRWTGALAGRSCRNLVTLLYIDLGNLWHSDTEDNIDSDMGFSVLGVEQRFLHHPGEKIHFFSIRYPPLLNRFSSLQNRHFKFGQIV